MLIVLTTACAPEVTGPVATTRPISSNTSTEPPTLSTSTEPSTTTSVDTTTTTSTTVPATPPAPALNGAIIVIDPGHNGRNWAHLGEINRMVDIGTGTKACNTTGTSTSEGYTEADFTWDVTQAAVPLLRDAGAEVILTRADNDGWGPCITERAAIGNDNHADAVVSIHADGGPEDGRGFHVINPAKIPGLTDDIYESSKRLAAAVHASYLRTGMPVADYIAENGYSERGDLGGLNLSDVPVVFLETGNMRNATDAALLEDAAFRQAIAESITDALILFLSD